MYTYDSIGEGSGIWSFSKTPFSTDDTKVQVSFNRRAPINRRPNTDGSTNEKKKQKKISRERKAEIA